MKVKIGNIEYTPSSYQELVLLLRFVIDKGFI